MEEDKYIHVIAFNVPYPPDYGGIIDIYYKLRAMKEAGVSIILHTFLYDRKEAPELNDICHKVYYYRRRSGLHDFFHPLPYIVITRQSAELERNILGDGHPVLFEGIHTTYLLDKCVAAGKKTLVRTHNIEHKYYRMLSKSERGFFRKLYLRSESAKLARYETILGRAGQLLSISTTDTAYFNEKYGNSRYVSAFHQHHEVTSQTGTGDYILFHGNLSVPENEKALYYLVKNVLSKVSYRVVIAGKDPSNFIRKNCNRYPHIELISNPAGDEMNKLVANAHINLLYTYQPTGLKLKLLHSLYGGRHCMANPLMLSGSGLDPLCQVYSSPGEATEMIQTLMTVPFDNAGVKERMDKLQDHSNSVNVNKIIELI